MNQELKEQARKEFRNRFSSPSGLAKIGYSTVDCRPVEDFIDSLIDKTVQKIEDRIVGLVEEIKSDIEDDGYGRGWNNSLNKIISLITNKSELSTNKDEK